MYTIARKRTVSTVISTAIVASMAIVFVLVVLTGIGMHHASMHGLVSLKYNLRGAHLISGILLILLASVHIWQNRSKMLQMFCMMPSTWRLHAHQRTLPLFFAAFVCTAVSAVVVACTGHGGAFHSGVALLFSVLVVFHMVINMGVNKNIHQ